MATLYYIFVDDVFPTILHNLLLGAKSGKYPLFSLAKRLYLGSDALNALFGTPRFECGIVFDIVTLMIGTICFAIGWRQKHDFAFWTSSILDLLISLIAAIYLFGWKDLIDASLHIHLLMTYAVAILSFIAGTHALFELGRTLIDFRRPLVAAI